MAGKQLEFPSSQSHSRTLELACWAISIISIVLVIIAIQTVGGGGLT